MNRFLMGRKASIQDARVHVHLQCHFNNESDRYEVVAFWRPFLKDLFRRHAEKGYSSIHLDALRGPPEHWTLAVPLTCGLLLHRLAVGMTC